jgi:hypothetical protein
MGEVIDAATGEEIGTRVEPVAPKGDLIDTVNQGPLQTFLRSTHVSQTFVQPSGESYASLPLAFLTSIDFKYEVPLWLLRLAIAFFLFAAVLVVAGAAKLGNQPGPLFGGGAIAALVGVGCLASYYKNRKQVLVIASPSRQIRVGVMGADRTALRSFASKVEQAQMAFLTNQK